MIDNNREYILCAAIHYQDGQEHGEQPTGIDSGYVLTGHRHVNIMALHAQVFGRPTLASATKGFLTSMNRFVTRAEAAKIAYEAKQTRQRELSLNSDDLY